MMSSRFGFILLPQYSALAYSSALEPLMVANQLSGTQHFDCFTASLGERTVHSSVGTQVTSNAILTDLEPDSADAWFVIGTTAGLHQSSEELQHWLQQANDHPLIAGVATGTYEMLLAGSLVGHRAAVHWPAIDASAYPNVVFSPEQFVIDRQRLSCRGGTAALDMMILFIAQQVSTELSMLVNEYFMNERTGKEQLPTLVPASQRFSHPKLRDALILMEANIEEPLTTDDIAGHVDISRRQLERLFKKHLNSVPSRYYLQLRLQQARQKLLTTNGSISDIGLACGFSSGAHFSTAYRNLFGLTPSDERQLSVRNQRWRQS